MLSGSERGGKKCARLRWDALRRGRLPASTQREVGPFRGEIIKNESKKEVEPDKKGKGAN